MYVFHFIVDYDMWLTLERNFTSIVLLLMNMYNEYTCKSLNYQNIFLKIN